MLKDIMTKFDNEFIYKCPEFGQEYTGGTPALIKEFIAEAIAKTKARMFRRVEAEINKHYNLGKEDLIKIIRAKCK
jgi:hypothetical protein